MGVLIHVFIVLLQILGCVSQANYAQSYTVDNMPLSDKALFLADSLVQHPVLFRKLIDIANTEQSLLQLGDNDIKFSFLLNVFLDQLPSILRSKITVDALTIFADELQRVNVSDINENEKSQPNNNTEYVREMNKALLTRLNLLRLTQRILTSHSLSEFLNVNETTTSFPCYNDVVTFLDAARGIQLEPRDQLKFTSVPWALKMLDALGIPPVGLFEGAADWAGSRDECEHTRAHLSPGTILAGTPLNQSIVFKGRYCQLHVNTWKKPFYDLRWGVCVPDSCSSQDIEGFMNLGILRMLQLPQSSVTCYKQGEALPVQRWGLEGFYTGCVGEKAELDLAAFTSCFLGAFGLDASGQINTTAWMAVLGHSPFIDLSSRTQSFITLDINKDLVIDSLDLHYIFNLFSLNSKQEVSLEDFKKGWTNLFT